MKNAGLTIGMVAIGLGLASIGFNLNGNQANATPAALVQAAGPAEPEVPRVVDYLTVYYESNPGGTDYLHHYRFWSHGVVDMAMGDCAGASVECVDGWTLIEDLSQGYVANADLNGDRVIDGEDLGIILSNYGSTSATLLTNPDLGDEEVVGSQLTGYPWWGEVSNSGRKVARLWSSGLVEMGNLPWFSRSNQGLCNLNDEAAQENGSVLCDVPGWSVVPSTITPQMRLGDINRDNEVSGGDLGLLLGDFGS